MSDFESTPVWYVPATGDVYRENPVPERAVRTRREATGGVSSKVAAEMAGIGRIDWKAVTSCSKKDIRDFNKQHEISGYTSQNAKTEKPRQASGKVGQIVGLSLAPHFYANLLAHMEQGGKLIDFDKADFNRFDGSTAATAIAQTGVASKDLINFCVGSSKWCRQTCLVLSGQNPATNEAPRAKMKLTWAFLTNPELFVAGLIRDLRKEACIAAQDDLDLVVRLNMLSDIPWYRICPELLEMLSEEMSFYDYTKVQFWGDPSYERVRSILDLTYSFSGDNERLCREALQAGERIAVAFADANPEVRATGGKGGGRTTWSDLVKAGVATRRGRKYVSKGLFGGEYEIVDGDSSDYRLDDPRPAIVALNFKSPNLRGMEEVLEDIAEIESGRRKFREPGKRKKTLEKLREQQTRAVWGLREREREARSKFALPVRKNPLPVLPSAEPDTGVAAAAQQPIPMWPVKGTSILIGPHVPTVLND